MNPKHLFPLILATSMLPFLFSCRKCADHGNIHLDVSEVSTFSDLRPILADFQDCELGIAPVSKKNSRLIFTLLIVEKNKMNDQYFSIEHDCYLVGHLAAITGDVELLRRMIYSYFGAAEGEQKGTYIGEFLTCDPVLFFSLPDCIDLWNMAGGAAWCCATVEKVIPAIMNYGESTPGGLEIVNDLRKTIERDVGTEWAKKATQVLKNMKKQEVKILR